jgi:hypothetical protein
MAHWRCLVCELLSVILFVATGSWETLRFDVMIQQGMVIGRPWETQLEARETGFVVILV